VNGAYVTAQRKVFGVHWGSRFGGGVCGPVNIDSDASYPGGVQYAPDSLGTLGAAAASIGGLTFPWMTSTTRFTFNTVQMPMFLPVPPGATAITAIQVHTQVVSTGPFVSTGGSVTLAYGPLNGGASNSNFRAVGTGSTNEGAPTILALTGPFAPPTPGHQISIEFRLTIGPGEGATPTPPLTCLWTRLAITWA
jgi:hypothetical protein